MAVIRHTISLSPSNNTFAIEKSRKLFDKQLSKYINYLINKEREKDFKRHEEVIPND